MGKDYKEQWCANNAAVQEVKDMKESEQEETWWQVLMALAAATASVRIRAVTGVIASDTASPCHRQSRMNPLRKLRRRAGRKSKRLRKCGWNGITSWKGAFVNMSDRYGTRAGL